MATTYRSGIGYDIHRLVAERRLVIAGVEIPFTKGLQGHSDADVLLHALCDALLSAAGMGDIGEHFPDTDPQYQGASSGRLLAQVIRTVKARGFAIENVAAVVVAQEPRLAPFKRQMKENLARLTGLPEDAIGVHAKTNEGLDAVGAQEAIAVFATCLLRREE